MDDTCPKPFVFVLMPFARTFDNVYEDGIKAACNEAGAYCERVDEQDFDGTILQRIYNQISKADIIVADVTGCNPNVFYETGYAHALDKRVIFLAKDIADIPFDTQHFPHIIYAGDITSLKEGLQKRVHWCIENPKGSLASVDVALSFWCHGEMIADSVPIMARRGHDTIIMNLDIHNPSPYIVTTDAIRLSIITPGHICPYFYPASGASSAAELPDGRRITNLEPPRDIFAEGWESVEVHFHDTENNRKAHSFPLSVRLFTAVGHTDFDATMFVPPESE